MPSYFWPHPIPLQKRSGWSNGFIFFKCLNGAFDFCFGTFACVVDWLLYHVKKIEISHYAAFVPLIWCPIIARLMPGITWWSPDIARSLPGFFWSIFEVFRGNGTLTWDIDCPLLSHNSPGGVVLGLRCLSCFGRRDGNLRAAMACFLYFYIF